MRHAKLLSVLTVLVASCVVGAHAQDASKGKGGDPAAKKKPLPRRP